MYVVTRISLGSSVQRVVVFHSYIGGSLMVAAALSAKSPMAVGWFTAAPMRFLTCNRLVDKSDFELLKTICGGYAAFHPFVEFGGRGSDQPATCNPLAS